MIGTHAIRHAALNRARPKACVPMKILVLMKQVANKDAILRINKDSTWIEEADLSFEVNESDGYALEESLRIKEKIGSSEVVVVSMGPQRAKSVIKDALARGADRAIHVV